MKILKFGGSSVGTPERIKALIQIVTDSQSQDKLAVVVSAFSGITDSLLMLAQKAAADDADYKDVFSRIETRHLEAVKALVPIKEQSSILAGVKMMLNELEDVVHGTYLVGEMTPRTQDFILGFGERLSAYIVAAAFRSSGTHAEYCDARDLIRTDERFGFAQLLTQISYQSIQKYFAEHSSLQIITGFIGSTLTNQTTTLGRGGSDYTASIFGAALGASEIQIWTDVDGFMTADPRKVKESFPIPQMSYNEALEMSNSGAKVLYPPTVQPAMMSNIPLRILNSFNPSFEGTVITHDAPMRGVPVCGISSLDDVALVRVQGSGMVRALGTAKRLFGALAESGVNVIFISQASSEHSICVAVSLKDAEKAKHSLNQEFSLELSTGKIDEVEVETNLSIIAAVGENMRHRTGIAGWFFQTLGKNGVNIVAIAQGSSELNISVVISKRDEQKALRLLHEVFFLSKRKTLNLFLVGTGLIGGTFLAQIHAQAKALFENQSIELRVVALARSKKMLFNESGIDLTDWKEHLDSTGEPKDMKLFLEKMKSLNLPNSIFIDCTASDEIIEYYESVLDSSISIVTPNKRANSGKYDDYKKLKFAALKHDVKFLYETNVGAGLPVINTLQDLLSSGDKILRIEAVLSGSLSFIFNSFNGNKKFSDVVHEAKTLGYTEPDPRDDLSGLDVARKLLILSRETGLPLELSNIQVEPFLPPAAMDAPSVDAFFSELKKLDSEFEKRKKSVETSGSALRFIATLENGKATVSLKEVSASHPFYSLSGSDNIISYTTERYKERPLVIKGPGAGAEVTAAGVFANVMWISNYLS